nr:hypothetical protein [Tanacetum cinerariifolium]
LLPSPFLPHRKVVAAVTAFLLWSFMFSGEDDKDFIRLLLLLGDEEDLKERSKELEGCNL